MRRRERVGSGLRDLSIGIIAAVMMTASSAFADWEVFVAPGMGISGAIVDTNGHVTLGDIDLFGSDDDSSPLLDLAVGVEVPMDELLPREWTLGVRLPAWPVRLELETAGLREYELRTETSTPDDFFTELKATTLLFNTWVDIPLLEIYRPMQSVLGLGRQPRVRRWIDPASFYVGIGIGVGFLEIDGTSNVVSAVEDPIDFAWNVGAGFRYALTDHVSLSAGYRYVDLGNQKLDLDGPVLNSGDKMKFDPEIHELRIAIQFKVYDFLSPWRRGRR